MQATVRQPSVLLGANKPSQNKSLVFSAEYIVDKVLRNLESTFGEPRYEVSLRSGDKVEVKCQQRRSNSQALSFCYLRSTSSFLTFLVAIQTKLTF